MLRGKRRGRPEREVRKKKKGKKKKKEKLGGKKRRRRKLEKAPKTNIKLLSSHPIEISVPSLSTVISISIMTGSLK